MILRLIASIPWKIYVSPESKLTISSIFMWRKIFHLQCIGVHISNTSRMDGWSHRNDENVLFLFYEDLKEDLIGSMEILAKILGETLLEDDLTKLLDHLDIKNFKVNPAINKDWLMSKSNYRPSIASFRMDNQANYLNFWVKRYRKSKNG